ncbi:MAG: hypothetical protein AAFN70_14455, partial [Planctomycetota bacterium]
FRRTIIGMVDVPQNAVGQVAGNLHPILIRIGSAVPRRRIDLVWEFNPTRYVSEANDASLADALS